MDGESVKQHHQPVDADADARRGRQAVFQRADVVGVVEHRLLVARVLARRLRLEARGLVLRIVELRKAVGELAAA